MKLASFRPKQGEGPATERVGVVVGDSLLALAPIARATMPALAATLEGPDPMLGLLRAGPRALAALESAVRAACDRGGVPAADRGTIDAFAFDDVEWLAPVPRPGKIVAIGRNYADHAAETGVAPFERPRVIFKMPSAVVGHGAVVPIPRGVRKLDFEVELAVIIGTTASRVTREAALAHVAGYTVLDDLTDREVQFDLKPGQTSFAKSMDGFAPMGPSLVTTADIPDPQRLGLTTEVNGRILQQANTASMLFPVAVLIEYISTYITLEPGDVIATGTPAGIGAFRDPPVWLNPGDRISMTIDAIGRLEHTIGDRRA